TQSILQLCIKQASGIHVFIRAFPISIAIELRPGAVRVIICSWRFVTINKCRAALPENGIGCCPSCALPILAAVIKTQCLSVHIYDVKQNTRGPALDRATEAVRPLRLALYKCIWPRSTKTYGKIM